MDLAIIEIFFVVNPANLHGYQVDMIMNEKNDSGNYSNTIAMANRLKPARLWGHYSNETKK